MRPAKFREALGSTYLPGSISHRPGSPSSGLYPLDYNSSRKVTFVKENIKKNRSARLLAERVSHGVCEGEVWCEGRGSPET